MQMKTQENKRNFSWQRVGLAMAFGALAVILAGIAIDRWRVRNGYARDFRPTENRKYFMVMIAGNRSY
ncbi:hypothetical protein [Nostoc sp. MG11]|uniref:hypothetical protein n=1 Tax=Nostoc sp. MG11 TaxID=2721166 RepID=UPI001865C024|nr:hypothetical protein [Nostoc sp. MG11]